METETPQIPQLSLNFDNLKHRMDTFLLKFDDHVSQARQKVFTERNDFSKQMSENKGMYNNERVIIEKKKKY